MSLPAANIMFCWTGDLNDCFTTPNTENNYINATGPYYVSGLMDEITLRGNTMFLHKTTGDL